MTHAQPAVSPAADLVPQLAGAGLLAATAAIHLDLYLTGYRSIPVIGWLFLLQVAAAFVLSVANAAGRSWLAAAAGAGFSLATLGGYLLSLRAGLFGFREVRTTAGIVAGIIEVAAFAVLGIRALALAREAGVGPAAAGAGHGRRQRSGLPAAAIAAVSAVALLVLGISAGTAAAPGSAGTDGGTAGSPPGLTVVIKNFKFSPAAPRVRGGERIEVRNEDRVPHTLTAGPARKFSGLFNTGQIAPGQSRSFVAPKQSGMVPFYCPIHPFMTGMLLVGQARASAIALAAISAARAAHAASLCGMPAARRRPSADRPAASGRAVTRPDAQRPPAAAGPLAGTGGPGPGNH